MHFVWLVLVAAEQFDWHINHRVLAPIRIKIDYHENRIVPRRCRFAVKQNCIIIGGVEAQVIVELKSAIFATNFVQARDVALDVTRRVPVAFLKLILLRVEILFPA